MSWGNLPADDSNFDARHQHSSMELWEFLPCLPPIHKLGKYTAIRRQVLPAFMEQKETRSELISLYPHAFKLMRCQFAHLVMKGTST
eukprot:375025-Pelagomonas_calceolata.AAC.2